MLEKCVIRSRSRISRRNGHRTLQVAPMITCMFSKITEKLMKQECIPVGCVPPACWPYRPLVDRIPACIAGGVPAGGCTCPAGCTCQGVYLPGWCTCQEGVPARGVYLPRGCTCPGGVPARGSGVYLLGVYLPRGVPARGVYLPRGCTCQGEWVYLLGVYLPRGCTCPGGVPVLSCTWAGTLPVNTNWANVKLWTLV